MNRNEQIKVLRKQSGMTQAQFCEYFGFPRRTLEDWEYGNRKPADYLIRLIAYKLTVEGLITKGV